MVYTCFVCKWREIKNLEDHFINKFPSDKIQKEKWLHILGKSNAVLSSPRATICLLHFEKNCFYDGAIMGRTLLKKGSLPSLYLTSSISNIPSTSRTSTTLDSDDADLFLQKEINEFSTIKPDFCESSSCQFFASTNEKCSTEKIAMKRRGEVTDENIPKKQICLEISPLEKSTSSNLIESNKLQHVIKKLKTKTEELLSLKRLVRRLRQSKLKMKSHMRQLQRKNMKHMREKKMIHSRMGPIAKAIFAQIKSTKKKVASYSLPLKIFASTVSFMSAKAYKYLRNIFPVLPHSATFRKWFSKIDVKPGICQAALNILREKHVQANSKGKKLLCNITVDDMAIRKFVRWNRKQYTGFVTYKDNRQNIENDRQKSKLRATEVMVIMAVCLNENWKIPLSLYSWIKWREQS